MEKQFPNRLGRPKGSRDWRLGLSQSKIAKLKRKLLSMALGGDMRAMQLCADRLWPKLRAEAMPIRVETNSTDLSEQGRALIKAALEGAITPDTLRDILVALYGQARLVEVTELEQRLAALEGNTSAAPWETASPPPETFPLRGRKRRRKTK